MRVGNAALTALLLLALAGCRREIVPEPFQPSSAHAAYTQSLVDAGLAHSALGQEWIAAASHALENGHLIEIPFQEALYVDPARPFAAGYRFRSRLGRRVEARVDCEGDAPFRLFVDLYRIDETGPLHVASASALEHRLVFEPRGEFDYLLRVQSELLRGGRIRVTVADEPALEFPVLGRDTSSIGSVFGAPREAGRRRHHGIDIFAPRHTKVVAASRGRVTRVGESRLGGLVIWIRDLERPVHHYYAHLQSQQVEAGQIVESGKVIGTVGNSGNARTTSPHLHFGLYGRGVGPIDPWQYFFDHGKRPQEPRVRLDLVGNWGRTSAADLSLREGSSTAAPVVQTVPESTPLQIHGATGSLYRATLPDGTSGFLPGRGVESLEPPLQTAPANAELALLDRPSEAGFEIRRAERVERVEVLGRFRGYSFVSLGDGRLGWARVPELDQPR